MDNFYDVDLIADITAANKFIPMPPKDRIFTGGSDQDFKAIGCDVMRHVVKTTGITPSARILEVGSGIGRVALPLTQFLRDGTYVGIDVAFDGVSWCRENITPAYPNFSFVHYDVANEFYNPTGQGDVESTRLPDGQFDVIILSSVFTHLTLSDTKHYLKKFKDALKPGGHVWGTWFMVEDGVSDETLYETTQVPLSAKIDGIFYATPERGTLAVAYPEALLRRLFAENGFTIARQELQTWRSGRQSPGGGIQDVIVLKRQ